MRNPIHMLSAVYWSIRIPYALFIADILLSYILLRVLIHALRIVLLLIRLYNPATFAAARIEI